MSKCREAFEQHCKERVIELDSQFAIDLYFDWQAAWNARGEVDAEICRNEYGHGLVAKYHGDVFANAIEQEQCE